MMMYFMSTVTIEMTVAGIKYLKLLFIDDLKFWAVKIRHRCVGAITYPRYAEINSKPAVSGMNTTVSARIGTVSATAAEGEPMRKPRAAGTTESSIIAGRFVFASVVPMISEVPDDTVTFLRSIAAKAAKVTSHTALLFRVFLNTVAFVFVIAKIVITPARVETAMSMFSAAVKKRR